MFSELLDKTIADAATYRKWDDHSGSYFPEIDSLRMGDIMDMSQREQNMLSEIIRLQANIVEFSKDDEVLEEQLSFAKETMCAVHDLHQKVWDTRVNQIRNELDEIMDNNNFEF